MHRAETLERPWAVAMMPTARPSDGRRREPGVAQELTAKGPPQPRRRVPMTVPMAGFTVAGARFAIGSGITVRTRNSP